MAMDKTTTRRMIGAIVLVLVAALVLAYLLKGKNENTPNNAGIQDVTLPSSPILAFPGNDGSNSINPNFNTTNPADKTDLSVMPPLQETKSLQGAKAIVNDYGSESEKPVEKKKVEVAAPRIVSSSQNSEEKSKKEALKKADVVKMDNKDKVSSSDHKASEKSQAKLVNEKKLLKYSDKAKEVKKEKPTESKEVTVIPTGGSEALPTEGYSIQLLTTGQEIKANQLQKLMNAEGYPSYIMTIIKDNATLYRVRIGAYQEKDEAANIQTRMKRRYLKNTNIQKSLVVENK
jgi:cell division septation protein DedD